MKNDMPECLEFFMASKSNEYETTIEIRQRIVHKDLPAFRTICEFDGVDINLAEVALAALNTRADLGVDVTPPDFNDVPEFVKDPIAEEKMLAVMREHGREPVIDDDYCSKRDGICGCVNKECRRHGIVDDGPSPQPPSDNDHVAEGCEQFTEPVAKPLAVFIKDLEAEGYKPALDKAREEVKGLFKPVIDDGLREAVTVCQDRIDFNAGVRVYVSVPEKHLETLIKYATRETKL